jgi:hypothetical protein
MRNRIKRTGGGEAPINVTRFLIRVTGEKPWNDISISRVWDAIEECLKDCLAAGQLDFSNSHPEPQIATEFDLSFAKSLAPKDAALAKDEGYLRQENPFSAGTTAHARWDWVYQRHAAWD